MSKLSAEQWQAVSPYLDQALTLTEPERVALIASLREQSPELAERLEALLEGHRALAQRGFLDQSPAVPPVEPGLAGRQIGAYTLVSPIGQGGMGTVWLAQRSDGRFERRSAVKFVNLGLAGRGATDRFKREGSLLGRLVHPHIAALIDAGVSQQGQPYLVLEHVEGEPIDQHCDQRKLGVEARLRLFLDVLAAVAHAHANLIVHRDLKPSNVLVRNDGQVKLLDFGIAKLLGDEGDPASAATITMEGGGALTPKFAAPEQVTGEAVTTATDVYALGVLLYLLLTGQHPAGTATQSAADLVKAILETEPPRVSSTIGSTGAESIAEKRIVAPEKLRYQLRGDLDTIVGKALKKKPEERYPSVTAITDDLQRYLKHEPIGARPDTVAYRVGRFVRRNRSGVALAAVTFAAIIGGVAGTLVEAHRARVQRDFAFEKLALADATNDLNSFLLSDAAPSGKPFTVNDLLGRAQRIVERQQGNDASRVELLISIGRQYQSQDEDAKALPILEEAYKLSRGLSDPSTRAQASCALGGTLALSDQLPRAEALIQEGLRELSDAPQFVLDRVSCLLRGSEVAHANENTRLGIERTQEAQRILQRSPLNSELLELRVSMDVAESYREAGRQRESVPIFERASVLMTKLGRDNTETAGTLFNNWALALDQLGKSLEAEKIFRRAIDVSRADEFEQAVSPMLLLNYGAVLHVLNRLDEAEDYVGRAYDSAKKAGDEVVINQSLLERAKIYTDQHNVSGAVAALAEVEPRLRKDLPPGHYAFAGLDSAYSNLAMERGDFETALRYANDAVSIMEAAAKSGKSAAQFVPGALYARAKVELSAGRLDEALADATRALSPSQQAAQPGESSRILGRAYLIQARILAAQGKSDEARAAARSAMEHLPSTVGPDHPDTLSARYIVEFGSAR